MSEIEKNPQLIFNQIKNLLFTAVKDRKHPFHTPAFSNAKKNSIKMVKENWKTKITTQSCQIENTLSQMVL